MNDNLLTVLAGIIVLGVVAQWTAWRLGLPSILLLLSFGLIAGPATGWIDPDAVFGDLLLPIVSLSVAVILYEGGLTLKMSELKKVGPVVRNLVTIGALVTWAITAVAAYWILGMSASLSALVGGVLVVTGPTVIAPLLRTIRPAGQVGSVLRWEGIVIDPIGALATVLIFEVILIGGEPSAAMAHIVIGVAKTIVVGGGLGCVAAGLLMLVMQRYWIADHLHNALSLMLVFAAFAASNAVQHESGLLAVTVMGFVMANQKRVDVESIIEFKENLQVLLITVLFIVLAARLRVADLTAVLLPGLGLVAVLVCVARPLSVLVSTLGSKLSKSERIFLSWMAPRGIVAAAVSAVFALRLESVGHEGAELLVPVTFITIIATVALYGLTAPMLARKLGVAEANPQGVLIAGSTTFSRAVATGLKKAGFRVLIVDTNPDRVSAARMAEIPAHYGNVLADHTIDELNLGGIGRLFAMTPNDWVNILIVRHFERIFGRAECYQLSPRPRDKGAQPHHHLYGRCLFGKDHLFETLDRKVAAGFVVKTTPISETFDYDAYLRMYGESAVPLFIKTASGRLRAATEEKPLKPEHGDAVIGLVEEIQSDKETPKQAKKAVTST